MKTFKDIKPGDKLYKPMLHEVVEVVVLNVFEKDEEISLYVQEKNLKITYNITTPKNWYKYNEIFSDKEKALKDQKNQREDWLNILYKNLNRKIEEYEKIYKEYKGEDIKLELVKK